MRVLAIPQVTAVSGETESDLTTQLSIVRTLQEIEPTFAYLWGRGIDERIQTRWRGVELFTEESTPYSFYALQSAVTGRLYELFNRITGPYPVDAVLTSRVGLIPALQVGLQGRPDDWVPTIAAEPRVYAPGDVAHQTVSEIAAAARAVGYALSTNVFWSEHEKRAALKSVELWMSPSAVDRAEANSHVIRLPVEAPKRLPARRGRKRLLFAGRLNSNKRWKEVVDAFRQVMQTRTDVDVWLHSGTGIQSKVKDNPDWLHMSERFRNKDDWFDLLKSANVGAYASKDEGDNLTVLEMLAYGIVMALPAQPWVDRLVPDYPYRFEKMSELPALLDWLLDNEVEARRKLKPVRDNIARDHDPAKWQDGWRAVNEHVRGIVDGHDPLYTFREDVGEMLDKWEVVTMSKAVQLGRIGTETQPNRRQIFNNYDAWRAVRDWDSHNTADPSFLGGLRDGAT